MLKLLNIHHASLIVSDLKRSLEFYTQVLGLAINAGRPDLGYPGAWLDIGAQQLHLMQLNGGAKDNNTEHGGRDRHIAVRINDLTLLQQALEQANIDYTLSRSGRTALFCRDPDGNALEFIQQE